MENLNRASLGYYYYPWRLPEDFPITLQYSYIQSDAPIIELHSHNVMELGYCHKGYGVFNIRNEFQTYKEGDVSIISRGEVHLAQSQKGTDSTWTFLFLDADSLIVPYYHEIVDTHLTTFNYIGFNNIISGAKYPEISRIMKSIINEIRYKQEYYKISVISLIVQLMISVQRIQKNSYSEIKQTRIDTASLERVAMAAQYIHLNYSEKILIDDLARKCNLSIRTFSRLFKQVFNKAPFEFIVELRLAMACNQLKNTDTPIALIAENCGFKSQSSFNRQFQLHFHISPREWRKRSG